MTAARSVGGVFDTLLVHDGRAVEVAAHWERFTATLEAVYGAAPPADLRARIPRIARARPAGSHRMRVDYAPEARPSFLVSVTAAPESLLETGDHAPLEARLLDLPGGLGGHKWRDRSALGVERDPRPPIVRDRDGQVLEAGHGNLVIVEEDGLVTPPLDGRILPGVTRRRVLLLAGREAIAVREQPIDAERLRRAGDVFVTSAIRGIQRIGRCEGVGTWSPSPLTARLARALREAWLRRDDAGSE